MVEAEYLYLRLDLKDWIKEFLVEVNKIAYKENFDLSVFKDFMFKYESISDVVKGSKIIKDHNEIFIKKHLVEDKEYLDNILNSNVKLDNDQRKVVLSDEDYTLVVAGAGAGKSTTVAAKVKYLIERKGIKPSEILVISFTNESVKDLHKKIHIGLGINCEICTFHKVGYKIIKDNLNDSFNVAVTETLYGIIDEFLKTEVLKEPVIINKLILFFHII